MVTIKIKEEKIPVILYIELNPGTVANTIANETGSKAMQIQTLHNVSLDEKFESKSCSEDVLDIVINEESYEIILKAIDNLSDTYQLVCKLKYINGLKEREIAEVLDLPAKTVSLRIFRGKQILRESLKKEQLHG